MARFIGTVQGNRGSLSRLGHPSGGLRTVAAGWQGSVRTYLSDKDGVDWARVELDTWHGNGTRKVLYEGPVGEYRPEPA